MTVFNAQTEASARAAFLAPRGVCRIISNAKCTRRAKFLLPTALLLSIVYLISGRSSISALLDTRENWTLPADKRSLDLQTTAKYVIVREYLSADRTYYGNSTVTLTTQGTCDFLHHVEILCLRWMAPISMAVYAPGRDFYSAVKTILYLRRCGQPCVRTNVTWHVIYDRLHAPTHKGLLLAREQQVSCRKKPKTSGYRETHHLTYPINVARNVARRGALTRYVFASDIELYPSLNLVPRFLDMLKEQNDSSRSVYVLPVFEMEKNCKVPETKRELLKLFFQKKAIFFHKFVCDVCHRFPNRSQWLKIVPPDDSLSVFVTTKRKYPWEPFYIGTNDEPTFDERFTWEGKMNKMPQVLEMCFMDYDFNILDNAFLVHSPGIKKINNVSERRRASYTATNRRIYTMHRFYLMQKYGRKRNCR